MTISKLDWKGAIYTLIVAVVVYFIKCFIIQNMPDFLFIGAGIFLIILGFILSILEKLWNIPFLNSIPNWQGAGVLVNSYCLVGIGLALVSITPLKFIIYVISGTTILIIQRSFMKTRIKKSKDS